MVSTSADSDRRTEDETRACRSLAAAGLGTLALVAPLSWSVIIREAQQVFGYSGLIGDLYPLILALTSLSGTLLVLLLSSRQVDSPGLSGWPIVLMLTSLAFMVGIKFYLTTSAWERIVLAGAPGLLIMFVVEVAVAVGMRQVAAIRAEPFL